MEAPTTSTQSTKLYIQAFARTTNDISTTTTIDIAYNFSDQANEFAVICEMLSNCNIMIATDMSTTKTIEEENAKNTAMLDKTVGELIHHAKSLEQRLGGTKDQTKASNEDSAELNQAVGTFDDTTDILESRLCSTEGLVSSIERLIVLSRKQKQKQKQKKADQS